MDYRAQLWLIYEARNKKNSRYSLSSFARDLNISVSTLSLVLNAKRGLSVEIGEKISAKLSLTKEQKKDFMDSIRKSSTRTKKPKNEHGIDISKKIPSEFPTGELSFELTWQHLILREYINLSDFNDTPEWLSQKLGLSKEASLRIWNESLHAGFITKTPEGYTASNHIVIGDKGVDQVISKVHKDLMSKAMDKIDGPREERSVSAIMLTATEKQYSEMKRLLRTFTSELSNTIRNQEHHKKEHVICVSTQIFKM